MICDAARAVFPGLVTMTEEGKEEQWPFSLGRRGLEKDGQLGPVEFPLIPFGREIPEEGS